MIVTTPEARRLVKRVLKKHGLKNRFHARRISFIDLSRAESVCVVIRGWKPSLLADVIRNETPGIVVHFVEAP